MPEVLQEKDPIEKKERNEERKRGKKTKHFAGGQS